MNKRYYVGVDVGTGSARAGVFDGSGKCLGTGSRKIQTWRPKHDFVEQSSDDIWASCGAAVHEAVSAAGLAPGSVAGVGFDATCSLVALGADDLPVTVSPSGAPAQNVVVWMDHRATAEASRINAGGHDVLKYVGGVISPEMQTPKLVWLKENLPETWKSTARFFDLPDFLVYRATGRDVRSLCTTVCKWTYLGHEGDGGRWDDAFFDAVGLGDLRDEGYRRIGTDVRPMGERAGELTEAAAKDLGLAPGTPVAVSIIDAHAGGLGLLGAPLDGKAPTPEDLERRLALIGGTSSCHMAVSREPRYVDGVWGPYFSAMVPGLWLTEGGQSATGALIDHVIHSHARGKELAARADEEGTTVYALLNERLDELAQDAQDAQDASKVPFPAALTREMHVLPYFHGNRSPRADPTLRGVVTGLSLWDTIDSLALQYLATIQAIAYGTRHIIDAMNAAGHHIDTLIATGGDAKNPVFLREHANATGCRIALPREQEAVLLGSAILGSVASGDHATVVDAMGAMSAAGETIEPGGPEVRAYHDRKHAVFLRMYDDQMAYRNLMDG
ncbi:MAG: FGGY-family carbohydrate kinase [Deltaproteobacteria bacterium]|nr:FGGY-family carbohydrate kinase [Deltaproteobacteria bacterium]